MQRTFTIDDVLKLPKEGWTLTYVDTRGSSTDPLYPGYWLVFINRGRVISVQLEPKLDVTYGEDTVSA